MLREQRGVHAQYPLFCSILRNAGGGGQTKLFEELRSQLLEECHRANTAAHSAIQLLNADENFELNVVVCLLIDILYYLFSPPIKMEVKYDAT